jgi:SapC
MTDIVVLNSQAHRALKVQAGASALFGDSRHFVAAIVNEFPVLVVHYPILFSKDAETGTFYCGVMLGFDEGENLFLEEGWLDAYRPLNLQRGPFYTAGDEVAIDLDNPRVNMETGEPLFTENGRSTPYLESIVAALHELRPGLERTKVFVETLLKLKLIEPVQINVGFDDGTTRDLVGLYTVNRDTLRDLPDATVLDLFRRGYLYLIHLMIASLKQVPVLAQRKNRQLLRGSEALSGNAPV